MNTVSSPLLAAGSLTASHGTQREQLAQAARQFEAIFLRQMLSAARKADFGEPLLGGQGMDTFRTMQDEHFADAASQSGAFGLGKQIEAQLSMRLAPLPPAGGVGGGPVDEPKLTRPPLAPPAGGRGIDAPALAGRGVTS
ncbi:MAG: rod-binding protein [Novosphingobium sp.]